MFIHIGGEYTISKLWIIGIFDLDQTTTYGKDTNDFLKRQEDLGQLDIVSLEIPRSFVVTLDRVYLSPISARTLIDRLNTKTNISSFYNER
ncbi:MAG: DUF370 domain-containing protein [Clostridiaceae bacterium]|nr:DUF370 domain-containing protein [Clostridiaceae bacterium]